MRWVVSEVEGVWYASCAALEESHPFETQAEAIDYAASRVKAVR